MAQEPLIDFRVDGVANLAQRVRSGATTAQELVQHALNQIKELNSTINAFVAVDSESGSKRCPTNRLSCIRWQRSRAARGYTNGCQRSRRRERV